MDAVGRRRRQTSHREQREDPTLGDVPVRVSRGGDGACDGSLRAVDDDGDEHVHADDGGDVSKTFGEIFAFGGVVVVDSILAVRAVVRRGTGGGEHARRASRRGSRRARPALEKKRAVGCRSFRVSVFVRGRRADVRLDGGGHRGPRLERGRRGDTTRV